MRLLMSICKHAGGCGNDTYARGWCRLHYDRVLKNGEPGPAAKLKIPRSGKCRHPDDCSRPVRASGFCSTHYSRLRRDGDVGPVETDRISNWKVGQAGYVIKDVAGKRLTQHRVVMEELLGRPLRDFENVHHKNGVRHDNRPENLELWVKPQPSGQRAVDLAKWAIETYPDLVSAFFQETGKEAS